MFKTIWTNLRTSVAGAIAGVPQILEGIASKNAVLILTGVSTLILGLTAKDGHK